MHLKKKTTKLADITSMLHYESSGALLSTYHV